MKKSVKKALSIVVCLVFAFCFVGVLSACYDPDEHEHDFTVYEIRDYCHLMECACGKYEEGEHAYDSNNVCTVCGAKDHEHEFNTYKPYPYDVDMHWIACECGVVGYYEAHDYEEGSNVCSKCHEVRHEHNWEYVGERDELYHNLTCNLCNKMLSAVHDCTEDAPCSGCGYTLHEHLWEVVDQGNFDEHIVKCTVCELTDIKAHDFENSDVCSQCGAEKHVHRWQWTGESSANIHYLYCEDCNGYGFEEHSFADGGDTCLVCGAPPHTHDWKFINGCQITSKYHQLYCDECGSDGWQEHVYGDDGKCKKCNHEQGTSGGGSTDPEPLCYVENIKRKLL
ncbi:MAG: hypothetical protein J1F65_05095 [Clostridiales bacterium]|nr:hypothetical protein [Clostridiales bacterium]